MSVTTTFPDSAESLANLEAWFGRQLHAEGSARIGKVTRLAIGHSNETFLVELSWTAAGAPTTEEFVLRTPPEGVGLLEPYDLNKQFRVMAALRNTKVPAPEALWNEPDENLLGRPFFVMRKVSGEIFERSVPDWLTKAAPQQVHRTCRRFIETLAAVHQVDWKRAGLGFLQGGDDVLGEEIELWAGRIQSVQQAPLPAFDAVTEWLRAHKPKPTPQVTLVHGDFKWGNVAFAGGEVAALHDWEMAGIGDPLTDLAYCLSLWDVMPVASLPGAMSRDEALAYYEELTGIVPHDLLFYEVLERYKVLVILLIGAMLIEAGRSSDLRFLLFGQAIAGQLEPLLRSIGVEDDVPLGPVVPSWPRIAEAIASTLRSQVLPEVRSEAARTQLQTLMGVVGLLGAGALPLETEVRRALKPVRSAD